MKVKAYYNLHKKTFSVLKQNEKGSWTIIGYFKELCLTDVEFRVSEAGRQRVLREKVKNVHAYVIGEIANTPETKKILSRANVRVTYNPYKFESFVISSNELPISRARYARLVDKQVFI